eukprot:g13771.t1
MEEDALEEGLTRIGLQNYRLLSLEDFMNLVKLLREEEAAQKQRQAGWTVSEAQDILYVRKGFEEQKQLLEKARLQSAVEGATEVTLSTCLYLLRFISEKGLRSVFGRESEAFHAEGCSEADVAAYRHLFRQIKNGDLQLGMRERCGVVVEDGAHARCEMPDTPSSGLVRRSESGLKVPLLPGTKSSMPGKHKKIKKSIKRESALAVPSSIQQVSCAAVMKFLRKLSQRCDERLTPLQQADLWKTIEDFSFSSPSRDFMDFASFVRVIGPPADVAQWVVQQAEALSAPGARVQNLEIFQVAGALSTAPVEQKQELMKNAISGFGRLPATQRAEVLRFAVSTAAVAGTQEIQQDAAELVQPQQLIEVVAELKPEERERMTEAGASLSYVPPVGAPVTAMGAPSNLTEGIPDPDSIEQQKRAYERGLDAELEQTRKLAEEQLKQQKNAVKVAAEQQLAMYKACSLAMEYQQRKMHEDLLKKQAEMQKEMHDMQRRIHLDGGERAPRPPAAASELTATACGAETAAPGRVGSAADAIAADATVGARTTTRLGSPSAPELYAATALTKVSEALPAEPTVLSSVQQMPTYPDLASSAQNYAPSTLVGGTVSSGGPASHCPNCGSAFLPDSNFCRKCGTKRPQV